MTTDQEIARWRLHTQCLVAPHAPSASSAVRGLLAVQAENPSQSAWAVASRTAHPDAAELAGLIDEGRVIRTHVLRPTWHYVAAADVGWLLELTAPRVRPVVARGLSQGGEVDGGTDAAMSAVLDALAERPNQTRAELAQRLLDRGLALDGQQMMLLLALLELDRLVCSGRPRDGVHTYALFAERVSSVARVDRDEALAQVALRYFTGHGPATERDLAYWATLALRDVRRGLEQVRDRLASFEHDGRVFWHATGGPPRPESPEPRGHLLQLLDELYRGHQDSRMVLDSEGIVPRGREPAVGMALIDGQLVARMRRTVGRRVTFDLTPFDGPLPPEDRAVLEQAAARYGEFLGLEHEVRFA